jgi:hypothetical protein
VNLAEIAIGPEELAIATHYLDVENDVAAPEEATQLFHDGLERIEVWCGSRKMGDILPKPDNAFESGFIDNSS